MADNETRVIYRAVADFSELVRSAAAAKAAVRSLKAEESAFNAASVAGLKERTAALNGHTKSVDSDTESVRKHTESVSRNRSVLSETATATRDVEDATNRVQGVLGGATRVLDRHAASHRNVARDSDRSSASFRRGTQTAAGLQGGLQRLGPYLIKTDKLLDKIGNWRPHIMPSFLALIPIVGGLLALVNPLVAGLGALSIAAVGFGASLGRVAVGALGAIPSLVALLSAVMAVKVAMGGVGGVFKAFSAQKKAAGGGGGGGGGVKQAEITQAEKLARAQEDLRRATQDVQFAEDDLDSARKDYIKRLKDLQKAVDRVAMSNARAAANAQLATEDYYNVLADPGSTKGQKMDATVNVDEATANLNDTVAEGIQLQDDLLKMQQDGIENDRQIIMATRAVTDAINRQRDAQIALINAQQGSGGGGGGGGGAANELQNALDKLSPSARKFVEGILSMDAAWTVLKRNVQEAFFSKFVDDVERLRSSLPSVESLLTDTAGAVGNVVDRFLKLITSPKWNADLILIGKQNVPILEATGDALIAYLDAFKDLAIIAGPFTEAFSKDLKTSAENFRALVSNARETGSLAAYLERVRSTMQQWWRIIKNIGGTLFNYSAAAGEFGDWLTDGFERVTKGWLDAAKAARAEGSPFQQYLENIKPMLVEVKALFADFFRWFSKTAGDPANIAAFTEIINVIRTELGPALANVLDILTKSGLGQDIASAIASIFETIAVFLDKGGAEGLKAFWDVVEKFFKGVSEFVAVTPEPVLKGVAIALASIAALRFLHLTNLLEAIGILFSKQGFSAKMAQLLGFKNFTPAGGAAGAAGGGVLSGGVLSGGAATSAIAKTGAQRGAVPGFAGTYSTGTYAPVSSGSTARRAYGVPQNSSGTLAAPGIVAAPKRAMSAAESRAAAGGAQAAAATGAARSTGTFVAGTGGLDKLSAGIDKIAGPLMLLTLAFAGASAAAQALSNNAELPGVDDGVKSLTELSKSADGSTAALDKMFQDVSGTWGSTDLVWGVNSLETAFGRLEANNFIDDFNGFGAHLMGNKSEMDILIGQFDQLDAALTKVDTETAREGFSKIADAAKLAGRSNEDLLKSFPEYKKQLEATATSMGVFDLTAQEYVDWMGGKIPPAIEKAKGATDRATLATNGYEAALTREELAAQKAAARQEELARQTKAAADAAVAASGSEIGYQESLASVAGAQAAVNAAIAAGTRVIDKNTGAVDLSSEAGRQYQGALNQVRDSGLSTVNSMVALGASQEELDAKMKSVRESFIKALTDMGVTSAAANKLADDYGLIPGTVKTDIKAVGEKQVREEVAKVNALLKGVTPEVSATMKSYYEDHGFNAFKQKWDMLNSKQVTLTMVNNLIQAENGRWAARAQIRTGGLLGQYGVRRAGGGGVPGRGNSDVIPAMLTPGEFVVRREIVSRYGEKNLIKFNKGVLSYAQLLKASTATNQPKAAGRGLAMFGGGGLVPGMNSYGGFAGAGRGIDFGGLRSDSGNDEPTQQFGDINIYYPEPETASDTLPRTIRKIAYVGSRSRA